MSPSKRQCLHSGCDQEAECQVIWGPDTRQAAVFCREHVRAFFDEHRAKITAGVIQFSLTPLKLADEITEDDLSPDDESPATLAMDKLLDHLYAGSAGNFFESEDGEDDSAEREKLAAARFD